jgi:hypothetical protein
MTGQELNARVEASRADWYARAAEAGITTAGAQAPVADTWAALNPGANWATGEDRAAELAHVQGDQAAHYADADVDVA